MDMEVHWKRSVMENRNVFYEQTADAIVNAVKEFETMGSAPFKYEDCRSWAERFSEERFKREIKEFVEEKYKEFNK